MSNEINDSCGVAGVLSSRGVDASRMVVTAALLLQNRGQEGSGVGVVNELGDFVSHRANGRFGLVFNSPSVLDEHGLHGEIALAHTRYRTTGASDNIAYAHPMVIRARDRSLMGIHNGNVANAHSLYEELKSCGVNLDTEGIRDSNGREYTPSDTEILLWRLAIASGSTWEERIKNGLVGVEGSFSLVLATDDRRMIAVRDPNGIRPLHYGTTQDNSYIVASETVSLDKLGASNQVEIRKGEMVIFQSGYNPRTIVYDMSGRGAFCDFEDWYFAHGASRRNGVETDLIREACGVVLADEEILSGRRVDADVVICLPDTARAGAIAFAERLGIKFRERVEKDRYEGGERSFIGSDDEVRRSILGSKFILSHSLAGKVIYVVDDTGVRLTTLISQVPSWKREVGVREVHIRLTAPKFIRPCVLGVNINNRGELGAVQRVDGRWLVKSDEQIARELGAGSIAFLSSQGRERVRQMFGEKIADFCGYCHGGAGPNFDMSKYDPELKNEGSQLEQRPVPVVV